jgi:cysteine-rich repeat protein
MIRSRVLITLVCLAFAGCGDDDGTTNGNQNNNSDTPICGNGIVELGEQCDDGASNSDTTPDACRTTCRVAHCGDAVVDAGEACDDGDDGSNRPDRCPATCLAPECGDGHVNVAEEVCDDGNTASGDGCRADCQQDEDACGDGVVDPDNDEACDGGALGGQTCALLGYDGGTLACDDRCHLDTSGCWSAGCGNGQVTPGEACDDGNGDGGDGCSGACTVEAGWGCTGQPSTCTPVCGDGLLRGLEPCDDGGVVPGDGCSDTCQVEAGWSCAGEPSVCTPVCGDGLVRGGEPCDDGNLIDHDGCSATCTPETYGWRELGIDPLVRYSAGLAFDGLAGRVVTTGGWDGSAALGRPQVYTLAATGWTLSLTLGTSRRLGAFALAADPDGERFVFQGGADDRVFHVDDYSDETLLRDAAGTWSVWAGTPNPGLRTYHAMAWDSVRDVAVLFGGHLEDATVMGDTWEFDGTAWSPVALATSPPARRRHVMGYDAARGVTVLFGGSAPAAGVRLDDLWEYDGTAWTLRDLSPRPAARYGASAAYDPDRGVLVLHGLWEYDGAAWTEVILPDPPPARYYASLAYDPVQRRMVLLGGCLTLNDVFGDTWELGWH